MTPTHPHPTPPPAADTVARCPACRSTRPHHKMDCTHATAREDRADTVAPVARTYQERVEALEAIPTGDNAAFCAGYWHAQDAAAEIAAEADAALAAARRERDEARADAATPGPWVQFEIDDDWDGDPIVVSRGVKAGDGGLNHGPEYELFEPEDADFIAHARTDVPLLAAIAAAGLALRKEIEEQWGPGGDALAAFDAAIRAAGEGGGT